MNPLLTLLVITGVMLAGPSPAAACSCGWADLDAPGERERRVAHGSRRTPDVTRFLDAVRGDPRHWPLLRY